MQTSQQKHNNEPAHGVRALISGTKNKGFRSA